MCSRLACLESLLIDMHWTTVGQWRMYSDMSSDSMQADTPVSPACSKGVAAPLAKSVEQTWGSLARHCAQACESVASQWKEACTDVAQHCKQANCTASSATSHTDIPASQCKQEAKFARNLSGLAVLTVEHPRVHGDLPQLAMVQQRMKRYCSNWCRHVLLRTLSVHT